MQPKQLLGLDIALLDKAVTVLVKSGLLPKTSLKFYSGWRFPLHTVSVLLSLSIGYDKFPAYGEGRLLPKVRYAPEHSRSLQLYECRGKKVNNAKKFYKIG